MILKVLEFVIELFENYSKSTFGFFKRYCYSLLLARLKYDLLRFCLFMSYREYAIPSAFAVPSLAALS